MITMQELLKGKKMEDLSQEIQDNLPKLLEKINKVRVAWNKPMKVTSCVRTRNEQIEVYRKKKIFDITLIPMNSKHIYGAAVDIFDPDLSLTQWLKDNPQIMEENDLYAELGNSNWVHLQILPFGSYNSGKTRWFNP